MIRSRRTKVAPLVALVALLALTAGCDWTQYGGNAARTGANPDDDTLTTANIGSVAYSWRPGSGASEQSAMTDTMLYVAVSGALYATPTTGGTCGGSPRSCASAWSAHVAGGAISAPVIDGDRVFVMWDTGTQWTVAGYDALGRGDCSGPAGCRPLWTGTFGTAPASAFAPKLAVADGKVYASGMGAGPVGTTPANLAVFDAAGSTGCTGTPVTCQPLFAYTASTSTYVYPAVADGRLYAGAVDDSAVLVFDANGQSGCSRGVCSPLFRLRTDGRSPVSVSGGVAYAAVGQRLLAFDAAGATGCTGSPLTCTARWTGTLTGSADGTFDAPLVVAGRVYVGERLPGGSTLGAEVFDATGTTGCSGSPKVCSQLWLVSAPTGATIRLGASKNLLFASTWNVNPGVTLEGKLVAYDLAGVQGCTGTPKTCAPLKQWSLGQVDGIGGPTVAHGRVAVSAGAFGPVEVFELPG
jgi:hypothetical protein